jgi:hypothetical protein
MFLEDRAQQPAHSDTNDAPSQHRRRVITNDVLVPTQMIDACWDSGWLGASAGTTPQEAVRSRRRGRNSDHTSRLTGTAGHAAARKPR